jgi:predicted nucleic acid-binding protein
MQLVYIDTNVVLDILDTKRSNHQKIKHLLQKIIENNLKIVISEDSLTTIYYIAREKQKVLDFFNVILEQWQIVSFGKTAISDAIALCKADEKLDFEDAVQCLCAKEKGCSMLITSDKTFVECGINIVDIDAFLAL